MYDAIASKSTVVSITTSNINYWLITVKGGREGGRGREGEEGREREGEGGRGREGRREGEEGGREGGRRRKGGRDGGKQYLQQIYI